MKGGDNQSNWLLNLDKIQDSTRKNYFSGLPPEHELLDSFTYGFVINKPKGRVGGDAYWMYHSDENLYLALFTCIGDGHLAHMMIRVYMNALKKVAEEVEVNSPAELLVAVHNEVGETFSKRNNILLNTNANIGVLKWNIVTRVMEFAGANLDLIQVARDGVRLSRGDKGQVGDPKTKEPKFNNIVLSDADSSSFYMCSSGIYSLIGGDNFKKLSLEEFSNQLNVIQKYPVTSHKMNIEEFLENWTGSNRQNDDILVIGLTP
jgi:serine phosphatase RsbU (regulator of sigma subunit)